MLLKIVIKFTVAEYKDNLPILSIHDVCHRLWLLSGSYKVQRGGHTYNDTNHYGSRAMGKSGFSTRPAADAHSGSR